LGRLLAGGLIIAPDQVLYALSEQIAALAVRYRVPTSFQYRPAAAAGGLMSYGANAVDLFRLAGAYTGRILKGEKPADLPVLQSTKFQFVINMQTARALGIDVPPTLLARADEVIE
jgi:putative ABC transport system substrate-binding protein